MRIELEKIPVKNEGGTNNITCNLIELGLESLNPYFHVTIILNNELYQTIRKVYPPDDYIIGANEVDFFVNNDILNNCLVVIQNLNLPHKIENFVTTYKIFEFGDITEFIKTIGVKATKI